MENNDYKYKYGDTFLDALFRRTFWVFRRAKNEYFYAPKWFCYWVLCFSIALQFPLIPFSGRDRIFVSHYLIQRHLYKTKYSYSELLEYKNDGTLQEKLRKVLFREKSYVQ